MTDAPELLVNSPVLDAIKKAILESTSSVKDVTWKSYGETGAVAKIHWQWWAFATLGIAHVLGSVKIREAIDKTKPSGFMVLIDSL